MTVNGILIANVQISNLSNGNSNISILANSNINISSNGVPNVFTVTYTGVNVSGTLNATGNANVGNLVTDTAIIATGNITTINSGVIQNGNSVIAITANGNINFTATSVDVLTVSSTGANISGTANVTGNLYASNLSVGTGNIISGNVSGGNLVSASYLQGTLTTAAQPNITSVGTLTSLNVGGTSNLGPVGNVTITGGTSGYYLQTNGSGVLTWAAVPTGTSISNGNSNVNIPVANGNVNISSDGNANVLVVTGTGANITGTANITGNIYAANANISGIAYATSFVPGSLQVTTTPSGSTTLLANSAAYLIISGTYGWTVNLPLESTLVLGQSYTINNNTGSGVIVKNNAGTTLFTVPSGGITQFIYDGVTGTNNWDYHSFLPYEYSAGGNLLQLGNSTTEVDLSVYGNITAQTGYQFIGNGFSLTSTNGANVVGNVTSAITANYANYAGNITIASQPNITEVGTLGNLLVSNNANVGNLLVSTNANVLGTLYTGNIVAANGNISITGNSINVANAIIANTATINGNLTAGNVNGGNLVQANYFIGNGVGITGLTLANSLSDVTISSPTLNQVIGYNGAYWVNQTPQTTTSAGSGVTFWFTGPTVIPTNANNYVEVDTLSSTPNTATVSYLSGNIPTNSTAVFGALQSGVLGRTALDAGTWTYGIWANANAVNAGTVTITGITYSTTPFTTGTVTLTGTGTSRTATASADSPFATAVGSSDPNVASYLQTPNALMQITAVANSTSVTVTTLSTYVNETAVSGNVWNELFLVGSANLTTTLTEYNFNTTQGTYVISNTASLGILITATSTRSQSTNVSVTLNGTTTASSVKTPLITLHDNLAGLQGGQSNEYFHLTQAEYTGTGTGNFVRQTSPTLITPNIGAATGTSLDTTGNITASNVYANSGTIGASLLTGTLTTAAQPNITSVGTLSSLSVTGNVTAGNLTGSLANGNSNVYIPSANGNVDITAVGNTTLIVTGTGVNVSGTLNATGNANVGNLGFGSGVITGTGNITGGNIIGTIAAGSNTITTTGNITGGNIIGIIAAGSNAITTTGNITSGNANLGNLVQANFATVTLTTTAANQSNITTVGTLTTLNVSGTSNLGPVSNVTITGGSSGQYLQTNGSGVLTWAVIPTSSIISNGNSNVSIPSGNGNVNIWTNGTKKWVFDTTGNLTTPSGILIDTNSNISNANIITANYLVASSGCVTIGGSTISVVGSDAGIFVGTVTNISMGLNANLSMGSATGTVTVNNDLQANGNITSNANIIANSNIISNANITATNTVTAANVAVGDLYSSRAPVSVGTGNVIVDQFPLSTYRSAKYTIKAGSDNGYQALEVLLVHDSINSIITVYGSLSTSGSDLVILNSTIAGGNVQLYALGLYANTVVNLMGTYVPD